MIVEMIEAASQLFLTPKILLLFGFKVQFPILFCQILNCWTAAIVEQISKNINLIVDILVACGTIGMCFIVFYLEILRKPNLEIEFKQAEPFCRNAPMQYTLPQSEQAYLIRAYWIRLRVINKGNKPAENCVGKLVEVKEINEKVEKLFQPFDPVVLHWVGPNRYMPITLGRGEYEYLDVIHTVEGSEEARINCDKTPRGIETNLKAGQYILKITIVSGNASPISKSYRLIWNGRWDGVKLSEI